MELGFLDYLSRMPIVSTPCEKWSVLDNSVGSIEHIRFVPSVYDRISSFRLKASESGVVTYFLPFPSILTRPENMKFYLDEMYDDVLSRVSCNDSVPFGISGVSMGNTLAFRLANDEDYVSSLTSYVGGSHLPVGIKEGPATRKVFASALSDGVRFLDYHDSLEEYRLENNLEDLPEDITLYLARFDRVVPYRFGKALVSRIKEKGYDPTVRISNLSGHVLSMLRSRKKLNKSTKGF